MATTHGLGKEHLIPALGALGHSRSDEASVGTSIVPNSGGDAVGFRLTEHQVGGGLIGGNDAARRPQRIQILSPPDLLTPLGGQARMVSDDKGGCHGLDPEGHLVRVLQLQVVL